MAELIKLKDALVNQANVGDINGTGKLTNRGVNKANAGNAVGEDVNGIDTIVGDTLGKTILRQLDDTVKPVVRKGADGSTTDYAILTTETAAEYAGMAMVLRDGQVVPMPTLNYITGFDRSKPSLMGTVSFVEATRTISISPSIASTFEFYILGVKHNVDHTYTVQIPDVTGTYYAYLDGTGSIKIADAATYIDELYLTTAQFMHVYWNAETQRAIVISSDDRHGLTMSPLTRQRIHFTDGFVHGTGGNIIDLIDNSDTYTKITEGTAFNDDIMIRTLESSAHPFLYRAGNGGWVETAPDNKTALMVGGTAQISVESAGTYHLEDATGYSIIATVKTTDVANPYKKLIGNVSYSSRSTARNAVYKHLISISLTDFPKQEVEVQFIWIVKSNGKVEDSGVANTVAYLDVRNTRINRLNE